MNISNNKKAFHEFEILEEYEAGLVLHGTEVKSVKAGHINIRESHVKILHEEAFLINGHISPYEQGNINNHDPLRTRKLLLNRRELKYLAGKVKEQGLAIVPLRVYLKGRRVKLAIGLAKGKKLHDKRQSLKDKDMQRDAERSFRGSKKLF
ncbi:MAG: SsrA-binding protein SmpB [Deferribacteraceae bacterium]|jgi:SsrA-binding protein|nr:SsrA-binding protein SmpB [Deferribacteraceae bacterium]